MGLNIVKKYLKDSIYDDVEHLGQWNRYEVYYPYSKDPETEYIGVPQYLLVQGNIIRWSDYEESYEILDFFYSEQD